MKRRHFLFLAASGLASPVAARSASYADDVVAQLTRQGFAVLTTESTWLGRVRITAQRNGGLREIVLNPRTGEILRDIWTPAGGGKGQGPIVDDVRGSGSNSGSGSDGGSGGDDGGDDHGSGDHGSGSDDSGDDDSGGNSGSGSGSGSDGSDDHGGKGKD
jgi:hypothetical protein